MSALAISVALAAASPALPDLGHVLRFRRPASCEMSAGLRRIYDQMVNLHPETGEAQRPAPIAIPGRPAPIVPRFERTRRVDDRADMREVTVELPLAGRWRGLRVISLRLYFMEESDVGSRDIVFADPPAVVRRRLNRAGFRLPALGDWRVTDPGAEGITVEMGLHQDERGVALICSTG